MRIFLDTANLADIQWAVAAGLIEGVTTTPPALAADGSARDHRDLLREICRLVSGPVVAEVVSVDADVMYRDGRELARVADNLVVGVPMLEEGIIATRRLVAEGVRVNVTLIFSAAQAVLAAKAGATYVSPFLGGLDDIGGDGLAVMHDVRQIFDNYAFQCEIVATDVRTSGHFTDAAKTGADAVTVPASVLRTLLLHPLTDRGLDQFLHAWSRRLAKARVSV